ncbi:T9SS type A sorting domain-containing protein [Aureisphaera galaxeae]|uniref:T9SS type A sorting domain-containing protein n=1 Tax=Aureisphaera galaxeae TaxID=1538023 RepID=UPI002350B865|nr:T9SS type A sorting domain-containing protein [Aureisphaera galaxeae]MDC8005897.1 T9SS type A sorting domain-containing protein [Aureisphaera galaxeae]
MKKLYFAILCMASTFAFAQVTVSTITSEFNGSGGLSLDDEGNLYIGDFGDFLGMADPDGLPNHVMKLDTDLNLTQYSTDFIGASGNAFDNSGVLHQSDIRANGIYKIVNGVRTFVTSDGIVAPVGIVFDSADNFYVCNCGNNTIRKVTPGGVSTAFASGSQFACPNGITVDENDNLYISNFSNTNIVKITPDGSTSIIGNTTAGNGHIDYDPVTRNLYIASYSGHQIFHLNIDTLVMGVLAGTGVRGNDDGDGTSATFSTPNGVAVTQTGDSIYINCAVPLSGDLINPQIIRLITGVTLAVEENTIASYKHTSYPNPANKSITVEAQIPLVYSSLTVRVYTILGELLDEMEIANTGETIRQTLDISAYTSGNYFYTASNGSKQLFNGKFIKE